MEEFKGILNEIRKGKLIELSWSGTFLVTKSLVITMFIVDFFLIYFFKSIDQNVMLIIIMAIFFNIYAGLQFFYTCEAYLKENKLSIEKIFRKEINIHIDSILKINSFTLKSTKYTIIKYEFENKIDWALIINSNSIIFGEEYSASEILKTVKTIKNHN